MPLMYAILANIIWGVTPIYFYFLKDIPAGNVIFMQVASTFILLLLLKVRCFSFKEVRQHIITAVLLLINWLSYFLAIQNGRSIEASLGYLILPFFTILCGSLFCSEKIENPSKILLFIAFSGVCLLIYNNGQVPVYGLSIAVTFSLYITIHKRRQVQNVLSSLFHESAIILPIMILFLLFYKEPIRFEIKQVIILFPLGFFVVLPLIFYLKAIRKITMVFAGLCQFISPVLIMIISILLFQERISQLNLTIYVLIAVLLFLLIIIPYVK